MMIHNTFDVTHDEAINEFLKTASSHIPPNGVHYHEGKICFIQAIFDPKETEKETLLAKLDQDIAQALGQIVTNESSVRYLRFLIGKGEMKADKIVEPENQLANSYQSLKVLKELKKEIESGTFTLEK